jgi:hypothetical protein
MPQLQQPTATNVSELVPTLERSVAKAREILQSMDDADLQRTWRSSTAIRN